MPPSQRTDVTHTDSGLRRPVVSVYSHFGLRSGPFDDAALSETFYAAPAHDECLATLCFVERTGKTCLAIVGETGVGKSYLLRLFLATLTAQRPVLYVTAGDPDAPETQATEYLVRDLVHDEPAVVNEGPLRSLLHTCDLSQGRPLVVVDHAEELTDRNRRDLLAVCDAPVSRRAIVLMLASTALYTRLAQPAWLRLRRRIFRICGLPAFSSDQVQEYITERVSAVGGIVSELFEPEALTQITRVTKGNPALINQLCENALIEAWSDDRNSVNVLDVRAATLAILGEVNMPALTTSVYDDPAQTVHEALPAPEVITAEENTKANPPAETPVDAQPEAAENTTPAMPNCEFSRRMRHLQRRLQDTLVAIRTGAAVPSEPPAPASTTDDA